MRFFVPLVFAALMGFLALPLACSSSPTYADGSYTGKSSRTVDGYQGEARIEVRGGKITSVECMIVDTMAGKAVDAGYSDSLGEGIGIDLAGLKAYSAALVETQDLAKVAALEEAPWSYDFFRDSAMAALGKSERALKPLSLADGTYEVAEPEADGEGYLTKGTLVVEKGRIVADEVVIWDSARSRPFDGTYEEVFAGNDEYIAQSRGDWAGLQAYMKDLVATQQLESVDALSGATWTYEKFTSAMGKALEKATKK